MKRLCMAAIVAAFAFAFTGCEKDTTKADVEKASKELGKSLDKAAKDLGNSLDSAAKDLSNKLKGK